MKEQTTLKLIVIFFFIMELISFVFQYLHQRTNNAFFMKKQTM